MSAVATYCAAVHLTFDPLSRKVTHRNCCSGKRWNQFLVFLCIFVFPVERSPYGTGRQLDGQDA